MTTVQIILIMVWLFVFAAMFAKQVTGTVLWIAIISAISFSVYAFNH